MKRKTIGFVMLLLITVGTGLMGCGTVRPTKQTAGAMVQKQLYQKYGIKTEVDKVHLESGTYAFSQEAYDVELHIKGDRTRNFTASVTASGDSYVDNYSKLIYGGRLERIVKDQIDKIDGYSAEYQLSYHMIEAAYTRKDDWKKYILDAKVGADVTLTAPSDETKEKIAKEMTPFLKKLRKTGFSASITVYQDDKKILFAASSPDTREIGYDEMLRWFR